MIDQRVAFGWVTFDVFHLTNQSAVLRSNEGELSGTFGAFGLSDFGASSYQPLAPIANAQRRVTPLISVLFANPVSFLQKKDTQVYSQYSLEMSG